MVRVADIPQIARMEASEKLLLLEELWDSISSEEGKISVLQSHKEALDARYADFLRRNQFSYFCQNLAG